MLKMFNNNKICFVFVTYNEYGNYDWCQICVKSLRSIFPKHPLVVVDHNNNNQEKQFLEKYDAVILTNKHETTHGKGLDILAQYCANQNYDVMIIIEPDCVISSKNWYDNLLKNLHGNIKMSSTFRYEYGPLHPCASAWLIQDIPTTFCSCSNKEDVDKPEFKKLIDFNTMYRRMLEQNYDNNLLWFFSHRWDVGIRNWFLLECKEQTIAVKGTGFTHFWGGHKRTWEKCYKFKWCKDILKPWVSELE